MSEESYVRMMTFLEDQMRLDELLAGPLEQATLHEPVLITRGEVVHIGEASRIDSFVKIEGGQGVAIGRFVHIASFAHIGIGGGKTIIEDYAAVASGGKIISGSNRPDALSMSASAPREFQHVVASETRLGKYSCVLTNGVVCPGITLGEGAVLAAGGVATKDIPAWEIWAGVPAKFIARRKVRL